MGWFANADSDCYEQVTDAPHGVELSHQVIASAAAYEAAKAYEKHCGENGKPASHAEAKELCAGVAGVFVDRMVETKGFDYLDTQKTVHFANKEIDRGLREEY